MHMILLTDRGRKYAYKILVEIYRRKLTLGRARRWEDDIEMNLTELCCVFVN